MARRAAFPLRRGGHGCWRSYYCLRACLTADIVPPGIIRSSDQTGAELLQCGVQPIQGRLELVLPLRSRQIGEGPCGDDLGGLSFPERRLSLELPKHLREVQPQEALLQRLLVRADATP